MRPSRSVKPKMTQAKAIAKNCLECAGGTTKERILCQIFDCPLWEWRLGCHWSSRAYKGSIQAATRHWEEDWHELELMGIPQSRYICPEIPPCNAPGRVRRKKSTEPIPVAG